MKKETIQKIVLCAMFTAVVIVLAQISIPMPTGVPITLQTFAVALCGYILGAKWGSFSIGIYVLLGAIGVPVFANFNGGLGAVLGLTGGFIFGFILLALFCGLPGRGKVYKIIYGLLGLIACHVLGSLQYSLLSHNSFWTSALLVSVPYLVKDMIFVGCAYICSVGIERAIKKAKVK